MSKPKQDKFTRMAKRLDYRIRVWIKQEVPFDDVIASTMRRVDRIAYKRGCHNGFLSGVATQKMRQGNYDDPQDDQHYENLEHESGGA